VSRVGRPREHGEAERAALLAATAGVIGAEGASAVTVRRVAEAAGVSTRAVYTLFGDKDGLLRAVFTVVAETMRRHHEAVPVDCDPVAEIRPLALAYRAGALEQPNLYEFYLGGPAGGAPPAGLDMALAWRSFERVQDTVSRCVSAGRFPGRDAQAVAMQLWAMVHGLASLELRGFLGPEPAALARWDDAVRDAVTAFQGTAAQ
jgi:AcrR family transcriptional regulator